MSGVRSLLLVLVLFIAAGSLLVAAFFAVVLPAGAAIWQSIAPLLAEGILWSMGSLALGLIVGPFVAYVLGLEMSGMESPTTRIGGRLLMLEAMRYLSNGPF